MKLKKLLSGLPVEVKNAPKQLDITGLCAHSDLVVPGNLFVAKKRGVDFIPKAVATGAAAVLTDIYNPFLNVPQVICASPEAVEAELANRFYEYPSNKLSTIAVTGTNGKTTISYMFRHIINTLGGACGVIGTIEYDTGAYRRQATLTTPDVLTTHKLFSEMVRHGCTHAAIEASSHGISQGRLDGVSMDVGVFSNLTQDHLDYHKTMELYAAAKAELFALIKEDGLSILNGDDPYVQVMKERANCCVLTYGMSKTNDALIHIERQALSGTRFTLQRGEEIVNGRLPIVGIYNVYNAVAASLAASHFGYPLNDIVNTLRTFEGVPGRLQKITARGKCTVFVDFAHTEDALRSVLSTLRPLTKGKLWVVFGCGGDRDRAKREKMGHAASLLSDVVVITSDNPRNEDPSQITSMIAQGCKEGKYTIILEREEAIAYAIEHAEKEDVVLVAGRGHEQMQQFSNFSRPFLDSEIVRKHLKKKVELV